MYAILTTDKCKEIGIDHTHRMRHDDYVVVTEKELMFSKAKGDDFAAKVKSVDGRAKTIDEIKAWDKMYNQIEGKEAAYEH